MSEALLDEQDAGVAASNAQLATPALSPISEHALPDFAITSTNGQSEPARERRRSSDARPLKLSPRQIHHLTTAPDSLPLRSIDHHVLPSKDASTPERTSLDNGVPEAPVRKNSGTPNGVNPVDAVPTHPEAAAPFLTKRASSGKIPKTRPPLTPLKTDEDLGSRSGGFINPLGQQDWQPSPMPPSLPIPPRSLSTYLHLELSSDRPSPLYIHPSASSDFPYESAKIKFERLSNFLLLPPNLEQVLWFGAIACLDAWLYTFTVLPLRFVVALAILVRWWGQNAVHEMSDLAAFVYAGLGRVRARRRQRQGSTSRGRNETQSQPVPEPEPAPGIKIHGLSMPPTSAMRHRKMSSTSFRHRRTRSTPSALLPNHKADLLQGLLIILSCFILMSFDASRMYHSIRGQAAIKLYVIYNVLEVFDRLFSAIGQDVLECLFSKETLERDARGRSKIFRPLWMFALALVYNVVHATALFYQVVTLNVAVNSYSNALLTLLMSNQFVEIKGTVFKKFEKENLFQLTCADVVERFQLWLMLLIIALRNIVEVGGLSISLSSALPTEGGTSTNASSANGTGLPFVSGFIIPKAFTLFPKWTGELLGPFLIVLGSEALVDWCKHAYITKFNNVKPTIYGRFLDVLAKDYYSHAFADQNLIKRLGLPVIPLSCLFIRACMQTYHMFLATHMPPPLPAAATSISLDSETASSSPATTAALQRLDQVFRRALGRSSFGAGAQPESSFRWWSIDDFIALATMAIFFLAIYLLLLAFKLVLGMTLLTFARNRYKGMKERERQSVDTQGRRVGGWGTVEVNEEKRRWIYEDDPDGLRDLREKEAKVRAKAERGDTKLDHVERYSMAAKRIW